MKSSAAEGRDPRLAEVLHRHKAGWVPVFLARASLGCATVVVASTEADSVALISAAEASAWLKQRGDAKGAAKVVGTPPPGSVWALGLAPAGVAVWSLALAPLLSA